MAGKSFRPLLIAASLALVVGTVSVPGMGKDRKDPMTMLAESVAAMDADLERVAEAGDPKAQFEMAAKYLELTLMPPTRKDAAKGVSWLSRSAAQGYANAQWGMGSVYESGTGVPRDTLQAADWYHLASAQGHHGAKIDLADLLSDGRSDPQDDFAQAFALYSEAAQAGYGRALNNLGALHENGQGRPRDIKRAAELYQQAADKGDAKAFYNLGRFAEEGIGRPKDHALAASLYEKAVKYDDGYAMHRLAGLLRKGYGVKQDVPRAVYLYKKAGDAGIANAWLELGLMHYEGEGVRKSNDDAIVFFLEAAKLGNVLAKYDLGQIHREQGNHKEAFKWTVEAAQAGYAAAQNHAGYLYSNGLGVEKNTAWAVYWYALAAQKGNQLAIGNLSNIANLRVARIITGASANLREKPDTAAASLGTLSKGTKVYPIDDVNGWRQVYVPQGHKLGYVSSSLLGDDVTVQIPARPKPVANTSPYPAKPAHQPGRTTCNTRCANGDCYRTYSDGRKVHFQAKQKFNPFNNQFEWDSGQC